METKLQLTGSLQDESEVCLSLTAGVTVLLRSDAGCSRDIHGFRLKGKEVIRCIAINEL